MSRYKNISGQKFGRLIAIERIGQDEQGILLWKCKCECGNEVIVRVSNLINGHTKSCGCLQKEKAAEVNTIHGGTKRENKSRLFVVWCNMKSRCFNEKATGYGYCGARGISVCRKWRESYEVFRKWSLENGYSEDLQIDRIDNERNYKPANCRWITSQKQNNNRRNNRLLTYQGETKTVAEWARKVEIKRGTLSARINRSNWSVKKALETPIGGQK